MRRLSCVAVSLLLALTTVFTLLPTAALAEGQDFTNHPTTAIDLPVGIEQTAGAQNSSNVDSDNMKLYYKFNVAKTSEVKLTIKTVPRPGTLSDQYPNGTTMHVFCADAQERIYNTAGVNTVSVWSKELPLEKESLYKVQPGTYYVFLDTHGTYNAYAFLTLNSITPIPDDSLGEPNNERAQAKLIEFNKQYSGNISYYGQLQTDGKYRRDVYDHYQLSLPQDNTALKIDFSRADDGRNNDIYLTVCDNGGSDVGDSLVKLEVFATASKTINISRAGTYFIRVYGGSSIAKPTEYSFTVNTSDVKVTGITLNQSTAAISNGKTLQLTATASPANATNKAVTWASSNPGVAAVDAATGLVAAKAKGTATITATAKDGSGQYAQCIVTITQSVGSVKIPTVLYLVKGKTATLPFAVYPENANNKGMTWTSSNKKFVTVTSTGKVKGIKTGKATVTVKSKDGGKTAKCTVYVVSRVTALKSVILNKSGTVGVANGKTLQLSAKAGPSKATSFIVKWKSSNSTIAKVDQMGRVTALKKGTVTITAYVGSRKDSVKVKVI